MPFLFDQDRSFDRISVVHGAGGVIVQADIEETMPKYCICKKDLS